MAGEFDESEEVEYGVVLTKKEFPDLVEADFQPLLPFEVERFARYITVELGDAQKILKDNQRIIAKKRHALKVAMASSRFGLSGEKREDGKTYTEQQKDDKALIDNQVLSLEVDVLEVEIEIAKGRIGVLKAQSDLVRSVMVSVRTDMEINRSGA